jgi:predicted GNAT family N-acyltransferase
MINSKWVFGRENLNEIIKLRMKVFRDELGHDIIMDADDEYALHIVISEDGVDYAAGRIFDKDGEFMIGMICVDSAVRGKQLGSLVVKLLITRGFELMAKQIFVNARACAVGFYEKLNFEPCGDEYIDDNGEKTVPMVLLRENSPVEAGCSGCAGCGSSGGCGGCH